MAEADYGRDALAQALAAGGVAPGDILFCHVSLGRLGRPETGADPERAFRALHEALRQAVGEAGTILVPTYSYSIGAGQPFDVGATPATIGPFPEYFRGRPGMRRSREPMLAVSGEGPAAASLFAGLPPTSYGRGSLYDRLAEAGAWICTIGLPLHWATFRHHVEELAAVPFRFPKRFSGTIREAGRADESVTWEYFAAPRIDCCQPDGRPLQRLLEGGGILRRVPVGRSDLTCIRADAYRREGMKALAANPWLTAKGPPTAGVEAYL